MKSSATGTRSSGKRRDLWRNDARIPPPGRPFRRPLTACRSGSRRWHWPRSCSALRPKSAYPRSWPASTRKQARRTAYLRYVGHLCEDAGFGLHDASGANIGRELFRLAAKARAAGRDPEMELRATARRYLDLVARWEQATRGV